MAVAKVVRSGRNQSIVLPKGFKIDSDQVYLKRTREGFVVMTRDPWELFHEGIAELSEGAFLGPRIQPPFEGGVK